MTSDSWDVRAFREPRYWLNLGIHIDPTARHVFVFLPSVTLIIGRPTYDHLDPWSLREWLGRGA